MGKRVRISNDSVNSYGTRVLTSGLDVSQYVKNPVLLWMHNRGEVIGVMKDLRVESGEVTGEPVFDCASELSERCKKQWEFGSLKMVSAGIDVLEVSDDRSLMAAGQTKQTITRSKLFEVSLVDIGSNADAIALRKDGETLRLCDAPCTVEWLEVCEDAGLEPCSAMEGREEPFKDRTEMELKTLALQLGLPETADEAAVEQSVAALLLAKEENETLRAEKSALELSRLEGMVDAAIKERRVGADRRDHFVGLGKKVGAEELSELLDAMQPQVRLSQVLPGNDAGRTEAAMAYKTLHDVPASELLKLRSEQPEEYRRLYEAEYGMSL